MNNKLSISNLPDSLKSEVSGIEDARNIEQLNLFVDNTATELKVGNSISNSFNAYDLWSRFVRNKKKQVSISKSPNKIIVERIISEKIEGVTYTGQLGISPAILRGEKEDLLAWPSDREEKVERALIRLASQGKIARISGKMGDNYAVYFTFSELINELKSVNQSLNHKDLRDSLLILKGAELTLSYEAHNEEGLIEQNQSKMNFLSAIHFSTAKGRSNVRCVAVLNELMSQQIDSVEYKGYYFNRTQSFKRSLSIWLSFRLYRMFRYASPTHSHHFRLIKTMIKFGSLDNESNAAAKLVALRRDMTLTMKDLEEAEILKSYKIESIKDDAGVIVDYTYTLFPSDKFCNEILELNKHQKRIVAKSEKQMNASLQQNL
ncbi:replication protein A [Pseudoalteromonas ulvae]|uniref:replication protein A n=1 Tax=Pseudoalteromonas ulvae TaxID=107327 RepID=UPI001D05B333|nr:replication protein A [Pseudoalteromonas ulvae]